MITMDAALIWINDCLNVFIRPGTQTFRRVAVHAEGKFNTGLLLVTLQVALAYGLEYIFGGNPNPAAFIFQAMLAPILLLLVAFWLHLVYRKVFKGRQNRHSEIFYLSALLAVSFGTLGIFLGQVPRVGVYLLAASLVYALLLLVLGLGSITEMRIWQSLLTVLIGLPLALISILCAATLIPSLMQATRQFI